MCLPFISRHRCFMRYACASSFHFLWVAFSLSHEICGLWRTIDKTFVHNSKSWINIFKLNQTTKTIKCTVMLSALECSRDPTPTTSLPSGAKWKYWTDGTYECNTGCFPYTSCFLPESCVNRLLDQESPKELDPKQRRILEKQDAFSPDTWPDEKKKTICNIKKESYILTLNSLRL